MNAIIEFFHYFYVKGTFYLLIASFTMHAYGQNLSNEALHKVMTYKKLMSGSMSVKKKTGYLFSVRFISVLIIEVLRKAILNIFQQDT